MGMESGMVQSGEISHTADSQPHPTSLGVTIVGTQKTRSQHNPVRENGRYQMSTRKATDKGKVNEKKRGSESPVHVTQPEDIAEEFIVGIGDMFVVVVNLKAGNINTLATGKCQISDE